MKNIIIAVIVILLMGFCAYLYTHSVAPATPTPQSQEQATTTPVQPATSTETQAQIKPEEVIGTSVESRDITAYHFGSGSKEIVFVAGIHSGYEWNTVLLANQLIDYLTANPSVIPASVKVTVIPVVNPDGLNKVVGTTTRFTASDVPTSQTTQIAGRFNAHTVDLNRNFDCDWKASGVWQTKTVSGGTAAFSEPESAAIKNYVESTKPTAVVVWYSSAGGVYSSNCHDGVLPETTALTDIYAKASGYPAHEVFDNYAITGDMVNWLAKIKIPAISVLLTNHADTEWVKNQPGIQAVLQHYAQ